MGVAVCALVQHGASAPVVVKEVVAKTLCLFRVLWRIGVEDNRANGFKASERFGPSFGMLGSCCFVYLLPLGQYLSIFPFVSLLRCHVAYPGVPVSDRIVFAGGSKDHKK